jgi:lipopolysaccharide export system protein LptA
MRKIILFISFLTQLVFVYGASSLYLERCDELSFDNSLKSDAQMLRGNVVFRHDKTRMYCDLADYYESRSVLDAFGNIRIVTDSATIYGDKLHYDGNTKMARIKERVRVVSKDMTMETDSLDFNQATETGYYFTGGKIHDNENVLTSVKSEMNFKTDQFTFRENVVLTNPKFVLTAPALRYASREKTVYFIAPTNILHEDSTKVHTEDGWYNTTTEDAQLIKNAWVKRPKGELLKADTILYNKITEFAKALSHVSLTDSVQQMTLFGDYGTFKQEGKVGFMNKRAYLAQYSSANDTMFVHAEEFHTREDSIYQKLRGIGNVRFYSLDMQGKCDSINYTTRDSIMNMYVDPVIWADSTQLTGDFMQMYQKNKKPDMIYVQNWALGISQVDSTHFDQLSGKTLRAYIKDNSIYKVEVQGNAETIYHMVEKDKSISGVNTAQSDKLTIYIKDKKMDHIVMTPTANGILYPESQLPDDKKSFPRFVWLTDIRPKDKEDIFTKYEKAPERKEKKKKGKK